MPDAETRPAAPPVSVEVRRIFAAPRARVFAAWSSADALKRWHAPGDADVDDVGCDFRPGGAWHVVMRGADGTRYRVSGHYREIDPPARIVLTWRWQHRPEMADSVVDVVFIDHGAETEVVLTHSELATPAEQEQHGQGWIDCFHKLAQVV